MDALANFFSLEEKGEEELKLPSLNALPHFLASLKIPEGARIPLTAHQLNSLQNEAVSQHLLKEMFVEGEDGTATRFYDQVLSKVLFLADVSV